ncbi:hypothetical protein MY11210_008199 [Beauveria gryllotalpidicola]
MSGAAITPQFRALGWNVHILCGPESDRFAGLFHPPGSSSLTYRDVVNELRLCFNIPISSGAEGDESADTWADIAFGFGYGGSAGGNLQPLEDDASTTAISSPRMISGQYLDGFVSTPSCDSSSDIAPPPIVRLHVVRHAECGIGPMEPLTAHLRVGCAKHIPYPSLRRDERYLPPNKASGDPRFARLPYRKTTSPTGGSQSPPKLSASGSVSPTKDSRPDNEAGAAEDVTGMVAPPTFDIPLEQARQTMAAFRTSCLAASTKCAVTGKGRSWYMNPNVGPAVQACHIVPQQHYHVYPVPSSFGNSRCSPRRLREAWDRTWSAENGLLLLSHLHELFDARLFSIHPETLRVRVFMPYDVLLDYHGTIAQLSPIVDRRALRHHYQMCCIENMTAKMPMSEAFASVAVSRLAASGAISPFESGSGPPDQMGLGTDTWYILDQTEEGGRKKRRRDPGSKNAVWVYNEESRSKDRLRDPYWDGCITSWNSQAFLADVNWELGRIEGSG